MIGIDLPGLIAFAVVVEIIKSMSFFKEEK